MKKVYLDNAATTPMLPEVIEVMSLSMQENFGNPSSIHQFGRTAKSSLENARKNIAKHFNATASEIIFTSSGTEANNLILFNAVNNLNVTRIITSKIEHHAVLHVVEFLEKEQNTIIEYVNVDEFGSIDLVHLEELLANQNQKTLVSLMHINNEIGNILDLTTVGDLCKKHCALFHSDTVQTIGHYQLDVSKDNIDFFTASAHKFHGPKGVGFAYFRKGFGITPMLHGGNQEKGARSSTENLHAIMGMEKALEIAYKNLDSDSIYVKELKKHLVDRLIEMDNRIQFNGLSNILDKSSFTILNARFPVTNSMFLFTLDIAGIAVSGGSACQSGSNKGSHVLQEFLTGSDIEKTSVRFSFSKLTTKEEIDYLLIKIKEQY